MPAYHSVFLDEPNQQVIGNIAILPLRTRTRGPAQTLPSLPAGISSLTLTPDNPSYDPIDETLSFFRANTLFRNFEIHGPADRTLIYSILFLSSLLSLPSLRPTTTRRECEKLFMNVALDTNFALPGDAGFPLNQAFEVPKDRGQVEVLRGYLGQVRQEVAVRLCERLFEQGDAAPSKWWLSFSKRKFMGKAL